MTLVVDGRFLAARATGLHRVARGFVVAAREAGVDLEVWAPGSVSDPLADRAVTLPAGRIGGRVWEQVVLPALAGNRTIWSLTNTAPLVRPGVVVVHDLAASVGPEWFAGSMRLYAATVLTAARRAQRVITVSAAVRSELVARGVRAERIHVVSPAVDERFAPSPRAEIERVRRSVGLPADYAVMVGWADPRKDVATAAAAHRLVVPDAPHDLVLVGERHPTFATVPTPVGEHIKVVGHVAETDLVALLSGAKVLLYPSRYEGFGLPPLEALACGTPAIASDIPSVRESAGGSVRLVAPGDVTAWAEALREALRGELKLPTRPLRAWRSVADELAAALPGGSDAPRRR